MSKAEKSRTFPVVNQKLTGALEVWRHDSQPRILFRNPDNTYFYEVNGERASYEDGKRCLKIFWKQNPSERPPEAKPEVAKAAAPVPGPESGAVPKKLTPLREGPELKRVVNPFIAKRCRDVAPVVNVPVAPNRLLPSMLFKQLALMPRFRRVQHFTVDLTGYVEVCSVLFDHVRDRDERFSSLVGPAIYEMSLYLIQCLWIKMGKFHLSNCEWTGAFERILKNSGLDGIYIPKILADYLENLGDCHTSTAEFKLHMPAACYPVVGGDIKTTGINLTHNNLPEEMFSEGESETIKAQVRLPRLINVSPGTLGEYNILTQSAYRSLPIPWAAWVACSGHTSRLPSSQVSPDVRSEVVAYGATIRTSNIKAADVPFDEPQLCLNYRQFAKCAKLFREFRDLFKTVRVTELSRTGSLASIVLVEKGTVTQLRCAVSTAEPSLTRGAAYCYRLRRIKGDAASALPVLTEYEPGQAPVRHVWQQTAEDLLFMRRLYSGPAQLAPNSPLIVGSVVKMPATSFVIRNIIDRL